MSPAQSTADSTRINKGVPRPTRLTSEVEYLVCSLSLSLAERHGWEKQLWDRTEACPTCATRNRSSDAPSQASSLASTWNRSAFRVCYEALLTPTCLVSFMRLACSPPAHKGSHMCDSISPSEGVWSGPTYRESRASMSFPLLRMAHPLACNGDGAGLTRASIELQAPLELLPKRRAVAESSPKTFTRMRRRRRMLSDTSEPASEAGRASAIQQQTILRERLPT